MESKSITVRCCIVKTMPSSKSTASSGYTSTSNRFLARKPRLKMHATTRLNSVSKIMVYGHNVRTEKFQHGPFNARSTRGNGRGNRDVILSTIFTAAKLEVYHVTARGGDTAQKLRRHAEA